MHKERKQELIKKYARHEGDTGSSEVQISLLSERVNDLTEHVKIHKRDHSTRRGLLKLVSKRRRLLNYLKVNEFERYKNIIGALGLRK